MVRMCYELVCFGTMDSVLDFRPFNVFPCVDFMFESCLG